MSRFKSLISRVSVAVPGIGLFIAVVLLDLRPVTAGFFSLIAAIGSIEMIRLMNADSDPLMMILAPPLTFCATMALSLMNTSASLVLLILPGAFLAVLWIVRNGVEEARKVAAGITGLLSGLILGFALLAKLRIDFDSPWVIFIPLLVCWIGDSAAYFTGSAIGRHKMCPSISPAKSWEGFAAGIAGSIAGALAAGSLGAGFSPVAMILVGIAGGLAAVAGDLLESSLKRDAGIKDSGTLLPGHGGILDRFDSLMAAVPAVWLMLFILGRAGIL